MIRQSMDRRLITLSIFLILVLFLLNACVVVGGNKGSDKEIASANVALAAEYYRLGRLQFALESVKKALKAEEHSVEANSLAALIYVKLTKLALAQEYFNVAVEYVLPDTGLYGQVHNNFGVFLCSNNQVPEGEAHFLLAAENKLYGTPQVAYENAGLCLLNKPDVKKAREYFKLALAIDPNLRAALLELTQINYDAKNYRQALTFLRRYHNTNKAAPRSLWLALQVELALGNKKEARKLLVQLENKFPDSVEAGAGSELLAFD